MIPAFGLAGPLEADMAAFRRLRAAGLFAGVRPLEALVQIRRARTYGDGRRELVAAVERVNREREAESQSGPITGTDAPCPSCKGGPAWSALTGGTFACGNCGFRGETPDGGPN